MWYGVAWRGVAWCVVWIEVAFSTPKHFMGADPTHSTAPHTLKNPPEGSGR